MASAQLQKGLASAKGSLGVLASRASSRAGLFAQVAPGLAAQRQAAVTGGQNFKDRMMQKIFPGLFKPNKAERELLATTEATAKAQQETSARSLQGVLELEGIGDAAALPDVRDAIQAAASGDPAGIAAFDALLNQGKTAEAARAAAKQTADIQQAQETRAERLFQQYGGLSPETWGNNVRSIGVLRSGKSQILDLKTLNSAVGKEVLPGAARGAYDGIRGQLLNTARILIEAKALQEGEIKLIEKILPEFGAFATLSKEEREVQLNELDRWLDNVNLGYMLTTPNADKVVQGMPAIEGRDLKDILATSFDEPAEPEPPQGTGIVIPPNVKFSEQPIVRGRGGAGGPTFGEAGTALKETGQSILDALTAGGRGR